MFLGEGMFLVLIHEFSQFIKIPLSKMTKTVFCECLQIYYLWTRESEVSELGGIVGVSRCALCKNVVLSAPCLKQKTALILLGY